jgi:hypothetical protein
MTDVGPAACAWDNDYYYIAVKYADIRDNVRRDCHCV